MVDFLVHSVTSFGAKMTGRILPHIYDWQGNLPVFNIVNSLSSVYYTALAGNFLEHATLMESGYSYFMVRSRLNLTIDFYEETKQPGQKCFRILLKARNLGKTAMYSDITITNEKEDKLFGCFTTKYVLFDARKEKPTEFPQWFQDKYYKSPDTKTCGITFPKPDIKPIPTKAFQTIIRTRLSDLDFNRHVKTPEYYRFCLECATEASLSGYYRHFHSNINEYPVKEMDLSHSGQCGPYEMLKVSTWQDDLNTEKIYFAIDFQEKCIMQSWSIFNKEKHTWINKSKI